MVGRKLCSFNASSSLHFAVFDEQVGNVPGGGPARRQRPKIKSSTAAALSATAIAPASSSSPGGA